MVMTSREKLLWLGCGLVIVVAVKGIAWQLREAARLSRVAAEKARDADAQHAASGSAEDKKQGTEDAISLETLAVLVDHPNYDIRQVARRIALNRFANDAECCVQLSKDYFEPDKHFEAAMALDELSYFADRDSLIRTPYSRNAEHTYATIEGILRTADEESPPSPIELRGPIVTLEEVGGDNGEVISLRLDSGSRNIELPRSSSPEFENPDDEYNRTYGELARLGFAGAVSNGGLVRTLRTEAPAQERQEVVDMAHRRARRREAMVVEVDGDEGLFELRQPI